MIAIMAALRLGTGPELSELRVHLLAIPRQFGLHLGWVLHAAMPREYLLIGGHNHLLVVFDVLDSRLNVVRRETEEASDLIVAPTLLDVIQHIVDGNARPGDFWPAPAIDD